MLKALKQRAGNRALKKRLQAQNRSKRFLNVESSKTLGVLYAYKDKQSVVAVNSLFQLFAQYGVKGMAIGYYNSKTLPLDYAPITKNTLFCQVDLNWSGCPISGEVESFINEEFDILIDLSRSSEFIYRYIASLSKASFKVGGVQYNNNPYDLIFIENSGDERLFIEQVFKFLLQIKSA